LPPEADSKPQSQNVCFVPNQTLMPRYRIDLTPSSVSAQNCYGGSRRGSKGNTVRGLEGDAHNAVAALGTVSGECSACIATGSDNPGKAAEDSDPRARRSATGNGHARARWAGCADVLYGPYEGEGGPQSAKIAVTDLNRLWGVTRSLSAFTAAVAAAIFWCLPSQPGLQQ
jgi:hypothetical protein